MKIISHILIALSCALAWIYMQIIIDSFNPCSNFSDDPEECGRDER